MNKVFNTLALPASMGGASFLALAFTEVSKEKAIGTAILCALGTLFIQWKFSEPEKERPERKQQHVTINIPDNLDVPVTVVLLPEKAKITEFTKQKFPSYAHQPRKTGLRIGSERSAAAPIDLKKEKEEQIPTSNDLPEVSPQSETNNFKAERFRSYVSQPRKTELQIGSRLTLATPIDPKKEKEEVLIYPDENPSSDEGSEDFLASSCDVQDETLEIKAWNKAAPRKKERIQEKFEIGEERDMLWIENDLKPKGIADPIVSKEDWELAQPELAQFYKTASDPIKDAIKPLSPYKLILFAKFWNYLSDPSTSKKFKTSLIEQPDLLKNFMEFGLSDDLFANRKWLVQNITKQD